MKNDKWEQWINSPEGKHSLEPSILKDAKQQEFLKNRLWHAFHAGNFPITGHLETKAEALLKEVNLRSYVPKYLQMQIKQYLKSIE